MLQKAIRNLKNQDGEGEGGFTLIELLVVILIIGILAAIALPTFLGQSDKAKNAEAKSNARNAVTQVESKLADGGDLPAAWSAGVTTGAYQGQPASVKVTSPGGQTYTVEATSKAKLNNAAITYTISKAANGLYTYTTTNSDDVQWTRGTSSGN